MAKTEAEIRQQLAEAFTREANDVTTLADKYGQFTCEGCGAKAIAIDGRICICGDCWKRIAQALADQQAP